MKKNKLSTWFDQDEGRCFSELVTTAPVTVPLKNCIIHRKALDINARLVDDKMVWAREPTSCHATKKKLPFLWCDDRGRELTVDTVELTNPSNYT